jgi:hypothetical protein
MTNLLPKSINTPSIDADPIKKKVDSCKHLVKYANFQAQLVWRISTITILGAAKPTHRFIMMSYSSEI